jgi:hypothetical protein
MVEKPINTKLQLHQGLRESKAKIEDRTGCWSGAHAVENANYASNADQSSIDSTQRIEMSGGEL